MPNKRHRILAAGLLHRNHISFLLSAAADPSRAVLGDSQASDDQPDSDFGAGQSQQLHQVPQAGDPDAGRRGDLILRLSAAVPGVHFVGHLHSDGEDNAAAVDSAR